MLAGVKGDRDVFRILVVDDDAAFRAMVCKMLETAGYLECVEAANGVEAMSRLEDVKLILTDLHMPGMSGVSLVKELREKRGTSLLPIIILTSECKVDTVNRIVRLGINDYIVKPFDQQTLIERVKAQEKRTRGVVNPR